MNGEEGAVLGFEAALGGSKHEPVGSGTQDSTTAMHARTLNFMVFNVI